MDVTSLLVFALALALAAGSPGPSLAALVAQVLARGWRAVLPFLMAMWLGELIWLTMAIVGLVAVAETFHAAFVAIKWLGVGYLAWLAWKMWTAPAETSGASLPEPRSGLKMFLSGMAVTLGNPKIMVFYLALLPTLIDLGNVSFADWVSISVTLLVVLAAIDLAYVVLAAGARNLMRSPRAVRIANRTSATAMGGAAIAIALRD
ncbi:MAG: LysE family translocator [Nisaea sp.]|jgi:threonine/homoserine/homoserine lactone efflux protein|uniref:LysE family translocator n=1 Tax=Nisaea sp. TaxID=2024842 RepID=UPI001B184B66|nr:LysE family translocator [Nisaea sp.]MBO6561983.1 LysE family translocator [Nisaea sp.]